MVNGKWYYCRNHGYSLTGYLSKEGDALSIREEGDSRCETEAEAYWSAMAKVRRKAEAYGWIFNFGECVPLRGLELRFGNWQTVTNPREAALYAFATKFYGNPSTIVQKAIWDYIHNYEDSSCMTDGRTIINDAADYYADTWINRPDPDNKSNLGGYSGDAKARILGNDYVVGPFKVWYDDKIIGNVKFVDSMSYSISVPGAQITDVNGNSLGGLPNDQDFYIRFPYTEDRESVEISVTVNALDSVEARKMDVQTQAYNFIFDYHVTEVYEDGEYYEHASDCWYDPGGVSENSCQYCAGTVVPTYKAVAKRYSSARRSSKRQSIPKYA